MFFRSGAWLFVGRGYPRLAKGAGLKIRPSLVRDPVAQAFEGSSPSPRTTTGTQEIDGFSEYLREKGLRESTVETKLKILRAMSHHINLWDSDAARVHIKRHDVVGRRKNSMGFAYRDWCRWKGFDYAPDKYEEQDAGLPYIPLERDLDQLIAGLSPKYACFVQLLKESAFRPGEAARLTPRDVDLERRIVTLNLPEKRSKPRQFRMSERLSAMMAPLLRTNGRIWTLPVDDVRRTYSNQRRRTANKLGNPALLRGTFKTLRHWKATSEYHRTKDILYVKEMLGHKRIENTLIYTHLVSFEEEDAYTVKVASTIEEFTTLLESGFEYVTDYEGRKILRKRK
jgi:integrase